MIKANPELLASGTFYVAEGQAGVVGGHLSRKAVAVMRRPPVRDTAKQALSSPAIQIARQGRLDLKHALGRRGRQLLAGGTYERQQGSIGAFAGMDRPASSTFTRDRLGWAPRKPGLIEDLCNMDYRVAEA